MKNRPFRERLGFALDGIRECWRTEANFRIQTVLGLAALLALLAIRPAPVWWALVGLVAMLVLALEAINSAFERLIDHLHPEIHPEIRWVKDLASGGVLLISTGALIVAAALAVALL
jgi:diacylglycerol kinase (ATP)